MTRLPGSLLTLAPLLVSTIGCGDNPGTGDGQDILEAGVCGAELAGFSFDCNPDFIDASSSIPIINHATTAVLEEVLECSDGPDPFAGFADRPGVAEYQQEL
jgi:hypothetical protein